MKVQYETCEIWYDKGKVCYCIWSNTIRNNSNRYWSFRGEMHNTIGPATDIHSLSNIRLKGYWLTNRRITDESNILLVYG